MADWIQQNFPDIYHSMEAIEYFMVELPIKRS